MLHTGEGECRKAHLCLRDILSQLRVDSTIVEMKHLLGQELKPANREVAVACDTLAEEAFRLSVQRGADKTRAEAKLRALNSDPTLVVQFSHCLNDLVSNGHMDRRTEASLDETTEEKQNAWKPKALALESKSKSRALRAYDIFVSHNFTSDLEGATITAKRRKLDDAWNNLSVADRGPYIAIAEQDNEEKEACAGENFVQFVQRKERSNNTNSSKSSRYRNERLRAVQKSIHEMMEHQVFESGSKLHSFAHGIRTSLIQTTRTRADAVQTCKQVFGYDHVPKKNPPGKMTHFEPCSQLHGGHCKKHDTREMGEVLTHNVYASARSWKQQFPVFLEFEIGTHREAVFLGKLIGRGQLAMFSKAVKTPGALEDVAELDLAVASVGARPTSYPINSIKFFH